MGDEIKNKQYNFTDVEASSSKKNKTKSTDPEMHSARKGIKFDTICFFKKNGYLISIYSRGSCRKATDEVKKSKAFYFLRNS